MSRLLPVVAATVAVSLAHAEGFFVEAGAGVATFSGGDYSLTSLLPPDPAADANVVPTALTDPTFSDDDHTAVALVAGGYRFTDHFRLRVAYQHFGRTTATSVADVVITSTDVEAGSITMAYSDEVQVVSFAPELSWAATPRLTLSVAPQLHWVFSDASLRTSSDSPVVQIIPFISRSSDELRLGGSVAAAYDLSDRLQLTARYDYLDLATSWDREAHALTLGLRLDF